MRALAEPLRRAAPRPAFQGAAQSADEPHPHRASTSECSAGDGELAVDRKEIGTGEAPSIQPEHWSCFWELNWPQDENASGGKNSPPAHPHGAQPCEGSVNAIKQCTEL